MKRYRKNIEAKKRSIEPPNNKYVEYLYITGFFT